MTTTPTPDPTADVPRIGRVARATMPGEPGPSTPPEGPGGKTPREFRLEDLPKRLAAKIFVNPNTGCWEWRGYTHPGSGYGRASWQGRLWRIHRLTYTLLIGPIPDELELDHVRDWGCVSTACCWPGHLEPVTHAENSRRANNHGGSSAPILAVAAANKQKTHCPQGHPYNDENTIRRANGYRGCKACQKIIMMRSRERAGLVSMLVKLPSELAQDSLRISTERGVDLSSWIAEVVQAEVSRCVVQSEARIA